MRRPTRLLTALLLACCGPGAPPEADDTTGDPSTTATTTTSATSANPTTGPAPATTTGDDPPDTTIDTGFEDPFCDVHRTALLERPRVMLVLDKSGTMDSVENLWDHDGDDLDDDGLADADPNLPATPRVTRWRSLHATVEAFLAEFAQTIDFGLVLYPSLDATAIYAAPACPVNPAPEVAPGPDAAAEILAVLPSAGATDLDGASPTTAAVQSARVGLAGGTPEDLARPQHILLVTDGAANCPVAPIDDMPSSLFEIYDDQLPVVVAEALAGGASTLVVGIAIPDSTSDDTKDGSPDNINNRLKLDEVALAGGLADHFTNATDQPALQAAFTGLAERILPCTLAITFDFPFQFIERVEIDQDDFEEVDDCASESGWVSLDPDTIALCGAACDAFRRSGAADVVFGCRGE